MIEKWTLYFILGVFTVGLIGCSANVTPPQPEDLSKQASTFEKQCADDQCPCSTPLGVIKHGTEITVYSQEEVACGQDCSSVAVQVTCNDGELSPEIGDRSFVCKVQDCKACFVGINKILHGENAFLYSQATVDCNESCEDMKGEVKCNDGILEGVEQYSHSTCQRRLCHCELPDQSSYLTLGGSRRFYNTSNPACGQKCSDAGISQTRTCILNQTSGNFEFDGDSQFDQKTCADPQGCECTLPGGVKKVPDGTQLYLTKSLLIEDCEASCPADADVAVRCANGDLVNMTDDSIIDIATTDYKTEGQCSVRPCNNCDGFSHNTPKEFHQFASPACGSGVDCSRDHSITRTCKDGTWMPESTSHTSLVCFERKCSCDDRLNGRYNIPVNSTAPFYPNTNLLCGTSCPEALKNLACRESVVPGVTQSDGVTPVYSYDFEEATAPFPAGIIASQYRSDECIPSVGCECVLPNGLGTIEDKTTVTLHRLEDGFTLEGNTVKPPCSQTCAESDTITVRCDSGTLRNSQTDEAIDTNQASFQFKYQCEDSVCPDCPLTGFGSIPNNQELTLYPKNEMTCEDNPELLEAKFSCFGGVLKKNGNVVGADDEPGVTWYQTFTNTCTGCMSPWGIEYGFGDEVMFYKTSGSGTVSNPCGQGCKSVLRTCKTDGTWDGIESELADFNLQACVNDCSEEGGGAPPRGCLLPWQNSFVTPDTEIPMWSKRQVGCGESCEDYFKLGKCDMETGVFDAGFEYIYQSCTQVCNQ